MQFFVNFKVLYVLKSFSVLSIPEKPFIYLVLCDLRFFYSPFFCAFLRHQLTVTATTLKKALDKLCFLYYNRLIALNL